MQADGVKGLACQKTMDGNASNGNGVEKTVPSCCLKAMSCLPEEDAKCHSTVVSGWFSEPPHPRSSGLFALFFSSPFFHNICLIFGLIIIFFFCILDAGKRGKTVYFNNPMWPGRSLTSQQTCSFSVSFATLRLSLFEVFDVFIICLGMVVHVTYAVMLLFCIDCRRSTLTKS